MPLPSAATKTPMKRSAPAKAAAKSLAIAAASPAAPARKVVRKTKPEAVAAKVPAAAAAKPTKPVVPTAPEPTARVPKAAKVKLVRDSFTMPADEYAAIAALKQRALASAHPAKKSELLRAGVKLLSGLKDAELVALLTSLPAIKTGRPKSGKSD